MTITISARGPALDGRAPGIVRDYAEDLTRHVTEEGERLVSAELPRVLQNPTGYYQSQIEAVHYGLDGVVTDDMVIYSAWLEGVGSRNAPVTRFKGYATFRRMCQRLNRRVEHIANERWRAGGYAGRLGG